ncbi:MAG TPA: excinuclease ABC subunit UvrC, partial [Chitinophagales bacterium]
EQDALLLENNLIKQFQPKYNVLLRDDKTYPYIVIKKEDFPRIFFTRKYVRDGSKYLGPYTSINDARQILSMLKTLFPLRTCSLNLSKKNIEQHKFKVCLEYHIKNCLGGCEGLQTKEDYDNSIEQIQNILESKFSTVIRYLKKQMNSFAESLEFEKANEFKEKIDLLDSFQSASTIVSNHLTNIDVYGYSETEQFAFVSYFHIANGSIIQTRMFEIKKVLDEPKEELLLSVVAETRNAELTGVSEIIVPFAVEFISDETKMTIPLVGDRKRLLDLATKNALYAKAERIKQSQTQEEKNPTFRILKTLKDDLRLTEMPRHIECFDNSNFQGTNAVSSIVVFKDGKPSKQDYRFFNVKTVVGANDFATMEEAVFRRYKRMIEEGRTLPNLIIIDGGKGQLSSAILSLEKLNIYGKIPIVGIAKRLEEIYFPNDNFPLYINKKSESLKLIQRLRDEAHRFGITAHRNKRSRNFTKSELTEIDGIGEKTMEQLLTQFKSLKKIKATSEEELTAVIGASRAKKLLEYFAAEN